MTVETVAVPLTLAERELLDAVRAAGRFTSDANAIRSALWSLALHLDCDVRDPALFALREASDR